MLEVLFYIFGIPLFIWGVFFFRKLGEEKSDSNFFWYAGKKVKKKHYDPYDSFNSSVNGNMYATFFILVCGLIFWFFHEFVF
ncbi:MAG: hypothetical protein DWP97_10175 [Calditrichaeota bacterium]|nr:MAG: hypothetical protein DWP97_10175 [Calditrichota bacterium]